MLVPGWVPVPVYKAQDRYSQIGANWMMSHFPTSFAVD